MPIVADRLCVPASADGKEPFLQGVSLTLQGGELTVVVGAAGSGKSTLLDALTGVRPPLSGNVAYDGRPLWRKGRVDPAVNRRIGALFQQPGQNLFAATVERELRYSLRPYRLPKAEQDARMAAALAAVGLPPAVLARSPFTLSGGQQRRIGLAATVVADPDWLFLDEPSAGLDPTGTAALAEWLRRRRAMVPHTGIVIATHDLDTFLPLADRVLVLRGGEIAADAVPPQLAERPELLLQAGVGLPAYIETAVLLRRCGLNVAADPSADAMADAISVALHAGTELHGWTAARARPASPGGNLAEPQPACPSGQPPESEGGSPGSIPLTARPASLGGCSAEPQPGCSRS
ncbi:energy-coupling factor ABC transporter ATP-binding protein, partial [Gordoniibacillus kamchatkensis]|uniref:energy-coupling factor ABC transporter ATP-binding protein n=1 Tax=Gordoniibacillus kamchatkensis TaxID=1590651 RepID=UPI0012DFFCB3